jgi:rhamnosyltransferase
VGTKITAVVVTFRPDEDVWENVRCLAEQLDDVVIVDNGSSADQLAPAYALAGAGRHVVVEMGRNAGLGAALNAGLAAARQHGAGMVLLFDQDSRVAPGFVDTITAFASKNPAAIVVPRYIDRSTDAEIPPLRVGQGPIEAIMTSGMTLSMEAVDKIGAFDEGLFIDCTDYEYSTRARQFGFQLLQCRDATLFHSPAKRKKVIVFGRELCTVSHYSSERRYYIARNSIYVLKLSKKFPALRKSLLRATAAETVKAMLFEKHRIRSAAMIVRGIMHAQRNITGYTVKL